MSKSEIKGYTKGYRSGTVDALHFVPNRTASFANPGYAAGYAAGYAENAPITVRSLEIADYCWQASGRPGFLKFRVETSERVLFLSSFPGESCSGEFDVTMSDSGPWSVRTFPARRIVLHARRPAMAYVRNLVKRHWLGLPPVERALLHQALRPRKQDSEEGHQLLRDFYLDAGHPLADFVDVAWEPWMPMPLYPLTLTPPDHAWYGPGVSVMVKDNVRHWFRPLGPGHHWDSLCGREHYRGLTGPQPDRPCQTCPFCFRLRPIQRCIPCQTSSSLSAPV